MRRLDPTLAAQIPELSRIVAFRNIVVHAYSSVDDDLVWQIIEGKLPELRQILENLLKDAPPP